MTAPTLPDPVRFLDFEFFPQQWRLERRGERVQVSSRALDILRVLISRPGEVVSKPELLERVWPHAVVDEGSIRFHMVALRRALGDSEADGGSRVIVTVPGRGYCFVAATSAEAAPPEAAAPGSASRPPRTGMGRIVGRDGDIEGLLNRLAADRCVSVVGPGGVGKSVVAAQVADHWRDATGCAVTFVALGCVEDNAEAVATAIAAALDSKATGEASPMATVLEHLHRAEALLVLDTCDAAIAGAAQVAGAILAAASGARLLTTSREPLRIEGETIYRLRPLAAPGADVGESLATAMTFPAARLFIECAANRNDVHLEDRDAPVVASVCRRVGGLPLALEIAAAQAGLFGVGGVDAQLPTAAALEWPGTRTASPRHRTLRAVLDWSYGRLTEAERAAFSFLAALESPFSVETVLAGGEDAMAMAQAISSLAAKSLLAAEAGAYAMSDVTRTYALAKRAEEDGGAPLVRHQGRCAAS